MANYVQDFQSFGVASGLPAGLTARWDVGTFETVDDGGDIILRQSASASNRYLASLDAVDADANRANCEVLAKVRSSSVAAGYHAGVALRASGTSTTEVGYYCAIFGDDMRMARAATGSTVTIQTASLTLSADTWYWIRFRANGTSLRARIWADGASEPGTWDIDTTDANISAAGWAGFFSGTSTKDCAEMAIATNGDTATMTPGGSGFSLAADAGSYAITGSAASLVATRDLAAGSGSYSVTGSDASLSLGRSLAADSGSYSITGAAAELSATRALEADSGAYTISGSDAALVSTRTLAADAGAYAITGADADLTYTPASEPGAYSLAANAGAYSIAGSDAGMVATRSLAADSGSYAIDGAAADLTAARALAADPGAYVITGADADLEYSTNGLYALAAESGSYIITGSDADFAYSGAPSGMDIEFELEPSLWWQRKPKRIEPEKAKEKLKAVAKVIAKKAEQHAAEPEPVAQRRAEVKQAVAPLIADMPGFDWRPVYEQAYSMALTAAIGDKMREREAKETAAREIERIRQLDEEDIAILVAMM